MMLKLLNSGLLADRSDEAHAKILLRVGNDDVPPTTRMLKHMMRAANPVQEPAGGQQLTNEHRTLHRVVYTHQILCRQD